MERYVIVGGVAAGATAAARLRRLDEEAEILLIERGPNVSYANCGLPYYIGGEISARQALFVATKESIEAKYNIKVMENTEVTAVDAENKTAALTDLKSGRKWSEPYTKLLLATGSSPIIPPLPGVNGKHVFTLWTVPDTDQIKGFITHEKPKRAVVVGAGFIGLEMVENLKHLGLEVDLVELQSQVMAPFDPDMSKMLENELIEKGVNLHLNKGVVSIHEDGRQVVLNDGSSIRTDMVLLSVGVRPNNGLAKQLGLKLNAKGYVVTDDEMRTSLKDIYAAGDMIEVTDPVTGRRTSVPLAGPANKQGRIAADTMVKDSGKPIRADLDIPFDRSYQGTIGTSIARVFDLSCASAGLNEKQLMKMGKVFGKDYAYSLIHPQSHAGYYPGALPLNIKLIFSLDDARVLGAQIVGYDGVAKRIDVIATTIRFGGTIYDLSHLELAYAPPFSSAKDPVNMAAFAACNIFEGVSKVISWKDAYEASKSSPDTVLLDLREETETMTGTADGAVCIPLTELRERLGELDKNKTYYVYCAVGLRGYIGERILRQKGFDVKNILGGIRTYKTLYEAPRPNPRHDGSVLPAEQNESERELGPGPSTAKHEILDVCGLSCPGPIVQVSNKIKELSSGDRLYVTATDPGFTRDIDSWCDNTGHVLVNKGKDGGTWFAEIEKREGPNPLLSTASAAPRLNEKTMIVFSGDLDKAIASFIIANGAAAMGNKVNMFFTFWGLNILRKPEKQKVKKSFMGKMFGAMMPRGSKKLKLSNMNFLGAGPKMIRSVMKKNNIDSLESLIEQARQAGVKMTACQMSMDVMGITKEELIDGVEVGGVATMLNDNDKSNMNLFI